MVASDHGPLFGVFPSIVGASFSWGAQGAAVGAVGGMVDGAWGKPAAKEALKVVGTKVGTHAAMFGAIAAVYGGAERTPPRPRARRARDRSHAPRRAALTPAPNPRRLLRDDARAVEGQPGARRLRGGGGRRRALGENLPLAPRLRALRGRPVPRAARPPQRRVRGHIDNENYLEGSHRRRLSRRARRQPRRQRPVQRAAPRRRRRHRRRTRCRARRAATAKPRARSRLRRVKARQRGRAWRRAERLHARRRRARGPS